MMTGRQIFVILKPIFKITEFALKIIPRFICIIIYEMLSNFPWKIGIGLRYILSRRLMGTCGSNVAIHRGCTVRNWHNIHIGNNVQIHPYCYLDGSGTIVIGNDVSIAHASSILSFNHTWDNVQIPIKYNPLSFSKVQIDDDVWIGCGVRILSGVEIKSHTIVAAGAVLTKKIYHSGIYGGVPARKIGEL